MSPPVPPASSSDGTALIVTVPESATVPVLESVPVPVPVPVPESATAAGDGPSSAEAPPARTQSRKEKSNKARVRTYSATDRDIDMLTSISEYHGFSRSAMLASLIRKEFWRCFPSGTPELRPDEGARTEDGLPPQRALRS